MDMEMRILMVGLDAAGKTTILYKLKKGEIVKTIPTIGFNVEEIEYKNIGFSFWDVGGLKSVRALWQHYVDNIHGLIFVVDSSDRERIDEAKYELTKIWNSYKSQGHKLLIIANKQDLPNSMNSDEITDKLDLPSLQDCDWYIQETNTLSDDNIYKGLDWLSSQLKRKQTAELFDKPT